MAIAPQPALDRLRSCRWVRPTIGLLPAQPKPRIRRARIWARRRGLLFGGQYYSAEVPVEVGVAVRAVEVTVSFHPDAPALAVQSVTGLYSAPRFRRSCGCGR